MLRGYSYQLYEMAHAALAPARAVSDATHFVFRNPFNPLSATAFGKNIAAGAELFERMTRRYGKPVFGLDSVKVGGVDHEVLEEIVWTRPFCNLLHFVRPTLAGPRRAAETADRRADVRAITPRCCAARSRRSCPPIASTSPTGTTRAWRRWPRAVSISTITSTISGKFSSISARACTRSGVCQPAVPLIAAVALMEAADHPCAPASMTLMGGPIDTRRSPTAVNLLAEKRGVEWFRANCLQTVPFPYPGFGRKVYPGYLQLSGFMAMNLDRHVNAHLEMFNHLVSGDGDSAEKHREFYDEYLAVMDLTAEYYMQTIETVFVRHSLPKGEMTHRGEKVDLGAIRRCGLMTVEGEKDDISGVGQTEAAQDLCVEHPGGDEDALSATGRRPLRRLQRLALPRADRAAHRRISRLDRRAGASRTGRRSANPPTPGTRASRALMKSPAMSFPRKRLCENCFVLRTSQIHFESGWRTNAVFA